MPNGTTYERWEKFCVLVVSGLDHVEARARSGYSMRCSRRSQLDDAKRLMSYPWIKARIAELQKKAEDAALTTFVERRKILAQIERATVADFVDEAGNLSIDSKAKLNTAAVQEIKTECTLVGMRTTLKLRDPVGAIAEDNKMEHVYESDKGVTNNTQINIIVETPQAQSLLERVLAGERTQRELPSGNSAGS